jgi:hypothetical protein
MKLFAAGIDGQLPEFMLHVDNRHMLQLVLATCLQVQVMYNPVSTRYEQPAQYIGVDNFRDATSLLEMTTPELLNKNTKPMFLPVRIDPNQVYHWTFQIDLLRQYAAMRNQCKHDFLIGDEHYVRAMIYSALHTLHEWRVLCVKDSIKRDGFGYGSATGWHKNRYDEQVKDWPTRFEFEQMTWSPLPDEDPSFYKVEGQADAH